MAAATAAAGGLEDAGGDLEPAEWDWKDGGAAGRALAALEGHLSCAVCSGFLQAPQTIKQCGHTFCSSCIRAALETKSQCPTCRVSTANTELKPAVVVDEACYAFKQARAALVALSKSGALASAQRTAPSVSDAHDGDDDDGDKSDGDSDFEDNEELDAEEDVQVVEGCPTRLRKPFFHRIKVAELKKLLAEHHLPVPRGVDKDKAPRIMIDRYKALCTLVETQADRAQAKDPPPPKTLRQLAAQVMRAETERQRSEAMAAKAKAKVAGLKGGDGLRGADETVKAQFRAQIAALKARMAGAAAGSGTPAGDGDTDGGSIAKPAANGSTAQDQEDTVVPDAEIMGVVGVLVPTTGAWRHAFAAQPPHTAAAGSLNGGTAGAAAEAAAAAAAVAAAAAAAAAAPGAEPLYYHNEETGEWSRDPPPELVAAREAAARSGGDTHLAFVPTDIFARARTAPPPPVHVDAAVQVALEAPRPPPPLLQDAERQLSNGGGSAHLRPAAAALQQLQTPPLRRQPPPQQPPFTASSGGGSGGGGSAAQAASGGGGGGAAAIGAAYAARAVSDGEHLNEAAGMQAAPAEAATPAAPADTWCCQRCTLINSMRNRICQACDLLRSSPMESSSGGGGSGGGSTAASSSARRVNKLKRSPAPRSNAVGSIPEQFARAEKRLRSDSGGGGGDAAQTDAISID